MKKFLSWLLVLVFLCSFCGIQAVADGPNEICGSYTLANMDDGSGRDMSEVMPMLAALGMSATLVIEEDGTAKLDLFGQKEEFTIDFENGVAKAGDTELKVSYKDETLTIGDGDMAMVFTKGELPAPKGVGTFDYYELESYVDEEGKDLSKEAAAKAKTDQNPNLRIFKAGDGVLEFYDLSMDLMFDFENGTFIAEEEEIPFSLEKDVLSFQDAEGATFSFRLADPGFVGPYVMTAMTDEDGPHDEELAMLSRLGMAPTLVIDETDVGLFTMFDEEYEMAFDFDAMTVTVEEEEIPFRYEMGTITLEMDGNAMTLSRVMELPKSAEALAKELGF